MYRLPPQPATGAITPETLGASLATLLPEQAMSPTRR
jgi:hypothetical protein